MTVDPMLGGDRALAELAAAAKNTTWLMLDGVFSHTGGESVYFKGSGNPIPPAGTGYDFTEYLTNTAAGGALRRCRGEGAYPLHTWNS